MCEITTAPPLFELRYNSFYKNLDDIPDDIYKLPITYSSFRRTQNNTNIILPCPFDTIAINESHFATNDQYIQYELYTTSIIENIAKQEAQNLC